MLTIALKTNRQTKLKPVFHSFRSSEIRTFFISRLNGTFDGPLDDSFGGFNMIKAEKTDYPSVIAAIEKGNFYCSNSPLIENLYMENNCIKADFSPLREVFFITEGRGYSPGRLPHVKAKPGNTLTHVEFPVLKEMDTYDLNSSIRKAKKHLHEHIL